MQKNSRIKIYTHSRSYVKAELAPKKMSENIKQKSTSFLFMFFYYIGFGIIKFANFIKFFIVEVCFKTGELIINSTIKSVRGLKNDFSKTKNSFPKRIQVLLNLQFSRALFLFLIMAFSGYAVLASLGLVAKGLQLKDEILHKASLGNNYLSEAKGALSAADFSLAQNRFALAYQTFSQGSAQFDQNGQALKQLLNLFPQKQDADRLLKAASLVAKAGQNFVSLEESLQNLKVGANGIDTGGNASEIFNNISEQLLSAQSQLKQANDYVSQVDEKNLPSANRESFVELKAQLANGQFALDNFAEVFNLIQGMVLGNKNILVMFENNNELRPSGGFMGTYGSLKLKDGLLAKINISSIYDLDGQLLDNIKPPKPLLNLGDRWYLRDSNWFADFPTSAKKISDFYETEGGQTPDMVIAITPNIILDWLKITGPVTLDKYNLTLSSENFVEQTQAATTFSDQLPTNSPKQILADLVPIILQKLSQLDKNQWPLIIQSLQNNLNNKQIVIYSRDAETQNKLEAFNWSGKLAQTDRDYLSIVSSNLGGTKTDLYMDQQSNLTSTIEPDGSIINELTITRTNKMPKLEATNNLSYIRVYVPEGSRLISNTGFDYKNLDYPENKNYKIDDDALTWEKNSVTDNLTGTNIGLESGKTYFGNWLNVDGGQSKTVKLVYQLPFKINNIDRYSLLIQKQIGSLDGKYNWNLNFSGYQVDWKNFDTEQLNTSSLTSGIILSKDDFLGMVLEKR